jgi:hypothetical protein
MITAVWRLNSVPKGNLYAQKKKSPAKYRAFLVGEAWRLGAKPQF